MPTPGQGEQLTVHVELQLLAGGVADPSWRASVAVCGSQRDEREPDASARGHGCGPRQDLVVVAFEIPVARNLQTVVAADRAPGAWGMEAKPGTDLAVVESDRDAQLELD